VKIKVKNINDYTRELAIDISWEEIQSDFDDAIKKFSKKIKMPGFRSGKIPRDRLLKQFQPNIEADFMDSNFQKYYLMAIQKEELIPVNKAEIKDVHFHMNEHFTFVAIFEIEPEVNIPKLKKNSLAVQLSIYKHDEQDIEDAILQLKKAQATIATVEDGALEGDYLVCTLQKLDETGVPIIGKKFEKQYLRVGKGSFTDDQKEKMIGLKPGDVTRLRIPVNQGEEEADYELKVDNVEREVLPSVDENFLKQINPDLDSVESLRDDVDKKIKQNFEERSRTAYERDLVDALVAKIDPSFAPSMVENYLNNILEDVKKQNNGEPIDEEKVREHYKPIAERNMKWYSIRNKIIDDQGFQVSKDGLQSEVQKLVERTPKSEKEIRKFYKKPSNLKRLEDDMVEKLILEYLEQFAKVKEVEVHTKDIRGKEHAH
tara:strand:- start:2316 stop:3605 length:1290 start_codon:yes stop_codon:yes gene_type:complete